MLPMSRKTLEEVKEWRKAQMSDADIKNKLVKEYKLAPEQVKKYLELSKVKEIEAPRDLTEKERLTPRETKQFDNFQKNKVREETSMMNQGLTPAKGPARENPYGHMAPAPMQSRRSFAESEELVITKRSSVFDKFAQEASIPDALSKAKSLIEDRSGSDFDQIRKSKNEGTDILRTVAKQLRGMDDEEISALNLPKFEVADRGDLNLRDLVYAINKYLGSSVFDKSAQEEESDDDYSKPENIYVGLGKAIKMLRADQTAGVHRLLDSIAYACRSASEDDVAGIPMIDMSKFSPKVQDFLRKSGSEARIKIINDTIESFK